MTNACAVYDVTIDTRESDGSWSSKTKRIISASLPYGTAAAELCAEDELRRLIERPGRYDYRTGHMVGEVQVSVVRFVRT